MEGNHYSSQIGSSYESNGISGASNSRRLPVRVLTVDEALPYSPFSSVVPFNSDVIPLPSVGLRSSTSIFSNATEREQGRQGLESLNSELLQNPHTTSHRLQKSLNELKELLKPEGIAQFQFKTTPKVISSNSHVETSINLSPFAKLVYDNTAVEFRYPSPELPSLSTTSNRVTSQKPKSPPQPRPQHIQHRISNQDAHEANSTIAVQVPRVRANPQQKVPPQSTSSQPISSQPATKFAVVIPKLPNDFRREQYTSSQTSVEEELIPPAIDEPAQLKVESQVQKKPPTSNPPILPEQFQPSPQPQVQVGPRPETRILPPGSSQMAVIIPNLPPTFKAEDYGVLPDSPDTPTHLSRRRKRSEFDADDDGLSRSVDQREKAETAARNLREYLQEIFEAEDQAQSGNTSSNIFTTTSEGIALTVIAQTKVETLLQKIISVGRFSIAPLEDLLRLQKICEGAMKEAESVDIKIEETMGESEIQSWLQQLSVAELGVKAARTSLRLMSGGREEKQLYSEDIIQSALDAFKNATENCIIPIVEMRGTGSSAALFRLLSAEKKTIINLLTQCRRLFALMSTLVANIELSETVINTLEFTTSRLIFVENAHSERDSIIGVSKFDSLRVVAMDVLAQIFLSRPSQRSGIFDEILTSLEKLPVTKQSARQFKLPEGGSIQLVSALIMRLIQTCANKSDDSKAKRRNKALEALNGDTEMEGSPQELEVNGHKFFQSEHRAEQQAVTAVQELRDTITPLLDSAKGNAFYVVNFIVGRAMKSTKTGDAPYRNLLDLFVEDFITCLNSTDWPAAELLLRLFLYKMVGLAEGEKTPAPAKNMALDLLGLMGAAISELNSHVRKTASSLENRDSDLGIYLSRFAESSLEKRSSGVDLVSWPCGPFRVCLEYLEDRASADPGPQLTSAIGFFSAEWASKICATFDNISDDDEDSDKIEKEYGRLAYRLRMMVNDKNWLSTEYSFEPVSPAHARLAYSLTLLHSAFCESFGRVLTILLGSMTSEQATVRSKSLRSVNQVLDTDPTILDTEKNVVTLILRCSNDLSVQVRDAALGLIGKCISLRPALEEEMIPQILQRVNDSGVGVRKRAMRLSKDIYLGNSNREVRSSIADALLHRVTDLDESVQELARQTIEEVWMSPFYPTNSPDENSAQFKLAMANHVALMVRTVQRGGGVATVLDKVLQNMLSSEAKYTAANLKVCKALVASMFETIIDNPAGEGADAPSARDALQILTIFAKSNPNLFTTEQIKLLQPYIANIGVGDDLAIYRSVVIIFRHVLPGLPKVQEHFLAAVRKELLPAISRVGKAILDDVVACIWIISETLKDYQHLTRLVLSTLSGIDKMKAVKPDATGIKKLSKLLLIAGMCGKHCDLDPFIGQFKQVFKTFTGDSISKLMSDSFAPFASPSQPIEVRKAALDAIAMVCQTWPKNFASANIFTTFLEVFDEKNLPLEAIIMRGFKDFLLLEEKRSEAGKDAALPGGAADSVAKLGVMGGGQGDGIAIGIAQRFLSHVVRIALSHMDEHGLLATEVVASIARQGLVHPKEVGSPLIALGTSPNTKISELAFKEHRTIHAKYESILEKEYMRAVQLAYAYQRDVVKNTHGATLDPYTAKLSLMMEVLKMSKVKNRKKFYDNMCARIEFDPAKMDIVKELPNHLEFSQFIIENMAFFDYLTVDELQSAITAMEKVVAATGTGIAHSIETEIFHISLEQPSQVQEGQAEIIKPAVDFARLQQLTASSMMLSSLWGARTYLRRQYGLMAHRNQTKQKGPPKDLTKAPTRAQGVNGDKFWEETDAIMNALDSEESMMNQCRSFVELLSVDQEFKVAAEADDEEEAERLNTPSEEEDGPGTPGAPGSGRGRKRKAGTTPGGRKKRQRSSSIGPRGRG